LIVDLPSREISGRKVSSIPHREIGLGDAIVVRGQNSYLVECHVGKLSSLRTSAASKFDGRVKNLPQVGSSRAYRLVRL
jgi:hypothetical protein